MTRAARVAGWVLLWLLVAIAATIAGWLIAGGAPDPVSEGLPSAGPLVAWGTIAARLITTLLGIATVGLLVVERWSGANRGPIPILALAWALSALVQVLFVLANVLALPLGAATSFPVVVTYVSEIASTRALLGTAALAFIISGAMIMRTRVNTVWIALAVLAAALPSLANHASGLGDHALALTSNVAHSTAATLWVGAGVALVMTRAWRTAPAVLRQYSTLALTCWLVLAASGFVNGYVRLETPAQLVTTGYGQLLLIKALLLVAIGF